MQIAYSHLSHLSVSEERRQMARFENQRGDQKLNPLVSLITLECRGGIANFLKPPDFFSLNFVASSVIMFFFCPTYHLQYPVVWGRLQ